MEEKKLTDEELNELIKKLEYQSWTQNFFELSQAAHMLKYQKAEIERLTEELDGTICMNEMYVKEVRQNAELQKQVDKLENRFENKACCNMSENCSMVQQAVKDTAKEIIEELVEVSDTKTELVGDCDEEAYITFYTIPDYKLKELAKRKGVEVE